MTAAVRRPGIWELAWPTIIANLLYSTAGFIDIKIVGTLGARPVAALTTGLRIFFTIQAVLIAVTVGATALVARAWGAGDRAEAARVTRMSLTLTVTLALVLGALAVTGANVLAGIFRLEPDTIALAATFTRWLGMFYPALAVNLTLGAALRAAGDVVTPLWVGALTNVVSVVVAYALVYGAFGLPALGVAGAAIGNGAGWIVGMLVLGWRWLRGSLVVGTASSGAVSRARMRRLIEIGWPAALEQITWQGGFVVFLWIVALHGTAPYAAYGIGTNILSFSFVVGYGFSIAAATLVGQHLGAGDPGGAARGGWRACGLAIAVMLGFSALIVSAAEPMARFLIDDPEVVRLTVAFVHVLGVAQPLMAIEFALGGALRGAGDTRFPFLAVLVGFLGVRVALASWFTWLGLSVEWVFAALIADYAVKATILTLRFRSGRWQRVVA